MNKVTSLLLENEYGVYYVSTAGTDLTGPEFVSDLVRPLMLASGYQPGTVDDCLSEKEECYNVKSDIVS